MNTYTTLLAVSISTIALFGCNSSNKPTEVVSTTIDSSSNKPFIAPPLPKLAIGYTFYKINATTGGAIKVGVNGSEIKIEPMSFVNKDGSAVNKEIEILYREYRNPTDIFLSGIPMTYDSAGVKSIFESAGMIDIIGLCDDVPIYVKEGKSIAISLISNSKDTYNVYALDTINKNWVYKGLDKVTTLPKSNNKTLTTKSTLVNKTSNNDIAETPVLPKVIDPKKYNFDVKFDKKQFPELAPFNNLKFEVTQAKFDPKLFNIEWDNMILLPSSNKDTYVIGLQKADTTVKIAAVPVVSKTTYEQLKKQFDIIAFENDIIEQKRVNDLIKERATQAKAVVGLQNNLVWEPTPELALKSIHTLTINGFGTWNSDRPFKIMNEITLKQPVFTDEMNSPININYIYVVDKINNTAINYHDGLIKYNALVKNIIFGVTSTGEFAYFDYTKFKDIDTHNSPQLKMELLSPEEGIAALQSFTTGY
ncbi:MAG: hypothetical protein ABL940_08605 [Bacteroidia bacterium]